MYVARRPARLFITAGFCGAFLASMASAEQNSGQARDRTIVSISVCNNDSAGGTTAACGNLYDTERAVLSGGPPIETINQSGFGTAADEHSTVFPPGYLGDNLDYLFFVASGFIGVNADIGAMAWTGPGPDKHGQWTVQAATASGYGNYASAQPGQVFLPPYKPGFCPDSPGDPGNQDQTFDLNYAVGGSLFKDPTSPHRLLMVYEGTNDCVGSEGGPKPGQRSYQTLGVATSLDGGRTWPRYASNGSYLSAELPQANPVSPQTKQGPRAPFGAFGSAVCTGNVCPSDVPATYGRYQILSPSISLDTLMHTVPYFQDQFGHSEPSAFLDDVHTGAERGDDGRPPAVYVVSHYLSDKMAPFVPASERRSDLAVARAQLDRSGSPLTFSIWNGSAFASPGLGGSVAPMLSNASDGNFQACGDQASGQGRSAGSISYVEETQQYLLVFVCTSPGDPAKGLVPDSAEGSAWFFATSDDLSTNSWSIPQEIEGSYADHGRYDSTTGCPLYNGWYPNLMSLAKPPGHLSTRGYVFYLSGSLGACDNNEGLPPRTFSSRQFTIRTAPR